MLNGAYHFTYVGAGAALRKLSASLRPEQIWDIPTVNKF